VQVRILTLSERLSQFAQRGRDQAERLRPGRDRDDVLQKVRQAEFGYSRRPVGFIAGFAGVGMMESLQSRARNRVRRIIDFRTRVANKSDWAINAVLNHFWSKLNPSTPPIQKNKDRPRH